MNIFDIPIPLPLFIVFVAVLVTNPALSGTLFAILIIYALAMWLINWHYGCSTLPGFEGEDD